MTPLVHNEEYSLDVKIPPWFTNCMCTRIFLRCFVLPNLNVCMCIPHLGLRVDSLGPLCCEIYIRYSCSSQICTSDSQKVRATVCFEVATVGRKVATIVDIWVSRPVIVLLLLLWLFQRQEIFYWSIVRCATVRKSV